MTTRKETLKAGNKKNKTLKVVGASHADKDRNQKRALKGLSAFTNSFCKVVSATADATAKIRSASPSTPESVQLSIVDLSSKIADMQHETSSKASAWLANVLETETVKQCASRIAVALTDAVVKSIKEGSDNEKLIKANKDMDKIIKEQDQRIQELETIIDTATDLIQDDDLIHATFSEEEE
tara:strand:+ start:111 stop:656 length:546 start_codon:yes stop_codon:yes gene_type:complete